MYFLLIYLFVATPQLDMCMWKWTWVYVLQ